MCNEHHDNYCACFCKKICGVVKLITAGIVLGSIAGMVAMYFFDRDKWLQCHARKVLKGAEEFTRDMQSKISNTSN